MTDRIATGNWEAKPEVLSMVFPAVPGYEILAELGRGGMGVVYKARQLATNRPVALKLIRDGALASPEERARFRIEAEAASRMQHSNIVAIYDHGEHQGRAYFAMELVEGGSLDQQLRGQPQAPTYAAELVRTLAAAVQHAHDQQVVHRDLKPANILLAPVPKITDFGLAKRLDSQSTAWTQDGAVLGTASYMAPEQAAGRVREIGPAVDVYALGAMLYELLIGRPPFEADSWNQTLDLVLHEEPALPTQARAEIPRDLETICLKCLEKAPERRYASAGALADDLSRFLAGSAIAAVPLSQTERLARLAARDGLEIVGELGRGPRSTVYQALDGPLRQPVVVKVFAAGAGTRAEWEARHRPSAELRAALTHPQLIPAQRAGWWKGIPYLAAEFAPHGSLAARLAGRRPFPVRDALRLTELVAEIVCYLHRQGVVHGNLKPSNILLGADGMPRLIDLRSTGGLFQGSLPSGDSDPAGLGYLAPELLESPDAELRPYTDIYGLGLILYEMLTGRPPFTGSTAQAIQEQVRSEEPVPPSQLNPKVTPAVEMCCLKCLCKNRWRRYARAYDFAVRLRSLQETLDPRSAVRDQPPEQRPPGDARA